jgi:hypothetical protein
LSSTTGTVVAFENLRQPGRIVIRVAVTDHDKGHAAVCGNFGDKGFQSLQSTGRCPDADDRKIVWSAPLGNGPVRFGLIRMAILRGGPAGIFACGGLPRPQLARWPGLLRFRFGLLWFGPSASAAGCRSVVRGPGRESPGQLCLF